MQSRFDDPHFRGPASVLAASLCFSTGGLLMKMVPWNPLAINGVRNVIAAAVIGLYILITRHRLKFNLTVLIGAVSMAGVTTLFSVANKLTTAGNTIILQYTAPIWIVILMFFIFGKKPDKTALTSVAIVICHEVIILNSLLITAIPINHVTHGFRFIFLSSGLNNCIFICPSHQIVQSIQMQLIKPLQSGVD
jgi:drug/metabolite transporter (DMT)-like permease